VSTRFSQHLRDLRHVHILCVAQPERLKLNFGETPLRKAPQIAPLFALGEQFGWIRIIHLFWRSFVGFGQTFPMAINANVPRKREKPRGKIAVGIKLRDGLECPHEGLLRDFLWITALSASSRDKATDTIAIAMDEFLKCRERPGLGLPGQIFVRERLKLGYHFIPI
jgi:hypothetical protein